MKRKLNLSKTPLVWILLLSISTSCSKQKTPDCGCGSETLQTIPDSNLDIPFNKQTTGLLFFKKPENIDRFLKEEEYNNRFWIYQIIEGIKFRYVICNDNILEQEFNFLKKSGDSIQITFKGETKRLCEGPFILPTGYVYREIIITDVKKQ